MSERKGYWAATNSLAEVRLTHVQADELALCSMHPQRRPEKANWTYRQLLQHAFVTSEPHWSDHAQRYTRDVIYTVTAEGARFLKEGRSR